MPHPSDHPGPFVLVDDVSSPTLAEDDLHHLVRVLRLRPGAALTVGDGAGRWRTAVLSDDDVEPTGDVLEAPRPTPAVTVGFALVKGGKPELIVQKLTELGVDRIQPFRAERSVVRWDDARSAKAHDRLWSVVRNAAMQSHRPWLPTLAAMAGLTDLVEDEGVTFADRDGGPPSLERHTILVGPEGGWSPSERALAPSATRLAVNVLRAETAAVTAGVVLTGLREGLLGRAT